LAWPGRARNKARQGRARNRAGLGLAGLGKARNKARQGRARHGPAWRGTGRGTRLGKEQGVVVMVEHHHLRG